MSRDRVLRTLCADCGIELNEQTRSWPVPSLCHVCETNDWWSDFDDNTGLNVTQPTNYTGTLKDALTLHMSHLMKIKSKTEADTTDKNSNNIESKTEDESNDNSDHTSQNLCCDIMTSHTNESIVSTCNLASLDISQILNEMTTLGLVEKTIINGEVHFKVASSNVDLTSHLKNNE